MDFDEKNKTIKKQPSIFNKKARLNNKINPEMELFTSLAPSNRDSEHSLL